MTGRLVRSADFERVLRNPPRAKTPHFALHHLADRPGVAAGRQERAKLSTAETGVMLQPVDGPPSLAPVVDGLWWGVVVPKRHARRSVTRTLLKRRMRMAMTLQGEHLDKGLWVIRLRAPFDRAQFRSAASDALASAVSDELSQALRHAAKPARR